MSNKITGDEPVSPCIEVTTNGTISFSGISIRQLALKDFMCAIVKSTNIFLPDGIEFITSKASELTKAYIEQLNK